MGGVSVPTAAPPRPSWVRSSRGATPRPPPHLYPLPRWGRGEGKGDRFTRPRVSDMLTNAMPARLSLHTPLCDLLGIRYPICQAGMGFVARADLAAAVCEAGGLGVIAAVYHTPDQLRKAIRQVRDATDKPFGVDILFAAVRSTGKEAEQFSDDVGGWVEVTLEERAPVLIAGLGNPGPVTAEAHRRGMKVMALCGNVKQAKDHAANGVDVVIAQGHEAGGHTGRVAGLVLIPAVVDAVSPTLVAAAGGIADGRGLGGPLGLGARGGQAGGLIRTIKP